MKSNPFNYPSIDFDLFVELRKLNCNCLEQFRVVPSCNPAYDLLQYRWPDDCHDSCPWRTFACVAALDSAKIKSYLGL